MVIKSVRAENFRSILDETIQCDDLTALVAQSATQPRTCSTLHGLDAKRRTVLKLRKKRANTQRKNAMAQHAWKPSDQPAWLTGEFYSEKVQPIVAQTSASVIARQISVSRWYAGRMREGYRPHPRHWKALAELVGTLETMRERVDLGSGSEVEEAEADRAVPSSRRAPGFEIRSDFA
jgi:hypothetical protein